LKNLGRATAMLIGPGVGCESATKEFIETLLTQRATPKRAALGFVHEEAGSKETIENALPPLVVDADGLRLLAQIKDWQVKLPAPAILTPHPGEMSALTGISREEIQQDRQSVALKFAREWGHVVVLKGAFTVIAAPDGRMTIIPVASPALARAGSGDALAGVIVGLRAQGLDAYDAATAGAWIHAQAGLYAADDLGSTAAVMASDIVNSIPDVLCDLE
ncbi:MAG TPA: NAD(P)H-hydrate dehydratase, partial [Anaerolineales bacterium]|nr:NAD(P)H-hydrate dehydratase [Anaerolineales bacterium]